MPIQRLQWFLFAAALTSTFAAAATDTQRFYGYAYDLKTGKYLYTEVYREEVDKGRWVSGETRYFASDGSAIGHKTLNFASNPYVPVYTLELPGVGYSEGISSVAGGVISMFKESRENGRQDGTVKLSGPMAADSGFHSFLYDHLPELVTGQTLNFRLAVAGQLDSFAFRVKKTGDTEFEDKPAVQLLIEPDSLLRFMVDPLQVIYDPSTRRLLEYRGISNVINPASGKAYNARIDYYSKPPPDAPKPLPPLD